MTTRDASRGLIARFWPWAVLLVAMAPSVWIVRDFPDDVDGEYPKVIRPTFNLAPPSAYRLAEPGDTLDRLALYASAAIVVISAATWIVARRASLRPAAMALGLAAGWFACTPGPGYDGWHGLGWRAIADPHAPVSLRLALSLAMASLVGVVLLALKGNDVRGLWRTARDRGASGLLIAALILVSLRAFDPPGVEPVGYWPRWSFFWGLSAFALALIRIGPHPTGRVRSLAGIGGAVAAASLMIWGGLAMVWFHRPLERLRAVVPGRVYVSAMPTYEGLAAEASRLPFRTIVNLFPEESRKDRLGDRLPGELRFVRERGIRYISVPSSETEAFLDETLKLAQDPSAWPILIHCHGCMDRSPAWMGIYRFLVQKRPLDAIVKEIEAHRGVRPKASITLLFARVLSKRAPEQYAADPTARRLDAYAKGIALKPATERR